MTTDLDRMIREVVTRMAEDAPPPPGLEELEAPVVVRRPRRKPGWWRRPALLVATLSLIVGGTLFLLIDRLTGEQAIADWQPATGEEWDAALQDALDQLRTAEAVEGIERGFIGGHLAATSWFTWRPDGETVVVQQTDVDVRETAWWLTSSSPPRSGERVKTLAWVAAGGRLFTATDEAGWSLVTEPPSRPQTFGRGLLEPEFASQFESVFAAPEGAGVVRRTEGDGTTVWTLSITAEATTEIQMRVHPDGHLAGISQRQDRVNPAVDGSLPIDASDISYSVRSDPPPVPIPEVGQPLDLAIFDLPSDYGIGP